MDKPQSPIRSRQSAMQLCDTHCHFFSSRFLEILTKDRQDLPAEGRADAVARLLEWDPPGTPEVLADRWIAEMAHHGVSRCALIASVPGDEESVAAAVAKYPRDFVGFFMLNPVAPDAGHRLADALGTQKLRVVALFPAMHRYRMDDQAVEKVFEAAAAHGAAVFVHCGVLSVGVRKRLGLPSPFDLRLGDPLAVSNVAQRFPMVPVIIPHFGAGLLREALMAADHAPNIHFDTSSSNSWMKYYPGLTLDIVFKQVLGVAGPNRVLFGTDSSFFPRGWQKGIYEAQLAALDRAGVNLGDRAKVLGGNFERLFPNG
jgi:predicted TIM-barrel fold metal-dependent hydrolase